MPYLFYLLLYALFLLFALVVVCSIAMVWFLSIHFYLIWCGFFLFLFRSSPAHLHTLTLSDA
jgi:hypothetical protein